VTATARCRLIEFRTRYSYPLNKRCAIRVPALGAAGVAIIAAER